jgi:hypothetical protein
MKKVILGASAMLFCTIGFAQVTPSVTSGSQPAARTVSALPGAAATANAGESYQNGNDHKVQVRQAGTNQTVYTEQNDGDGAGGNLASVMQTGSVSSVSGAENAAEVIQQGTANESTLIQQGDRNNAITEQGLTDLESTGNKARIQQGNGGGSEDNTAAIRQDGDYNEANTFQTWDNNDAFTIQDGESNKSMIVQNGGGENLAGQEALAEQYGDRNESSIAQGGAGGRNVANTIQDGDDNHAKQTQNTIAASGMLAETALINQGNEATFAGVGSTLNNMLDNGQNLYDELDAVDNITNGSFNPGSQGGIAFQTQNGKMSAAEIHQFGSGSQAGNYAEQYQDGWNQNALIVQNAYGNSNGGDNYARQEQHVDNNDAAIAQNGRGNKAFQYQTDRRNMALSTQRGAGNLVNTYQFGNDNKVTTAQRGQSNAALVVQRGGQSYVASQNIPGGNPNGNNQIDVYQGGPTDDFSNMIDCGFDMPMDPMVIPEVPTLTIGDICPDC